MGAAALQAIPEPAIDRELVRRGGLHEFVRVAWEQVDPTSTFRDNWHIGAVCEHLTAVSLGQIRRLLINMPPGTSKSRCVSVMWPAWEWGPESHPALKWIFGSYDIDLARNDNNRMRRLLESEWFCERWGDVRPDARAVDSSSIRWTQTEFENRHGGWRFACTPGGKVLGRHADIQVADDPNKPQDASGRRAVTRAALDDVWTWWRATMATRLRDLQTGRRVVMQQRVHDADLSGHLLEEQGYEHLCLPMHHDPSRICRTSLGTPDPRTEQGELLAPDRMPAVEVARMEHELGAAASAAQLEQKPPSAGGRIFEASWFTKRWRTIPQGCRWLQSWDFAFKGGNTSDWVVGQVWAWLGARILLVHQVRRRMTFTESCEAIVELSAAYPQALEKLVEDKANGTAVVDMLTATVPGLVLVNPEGGKESRANAVQPLLQAGNVELPERGEWIDAYIVEMTGFPLALHDDQVDATSQALLRIRKDLTAGDNYEAFVDGLTAALGDDD